MYSSKMINIFFQYPTINSDKYIIRCPNKSDLEDIAGICGEKEISEIARIPYIKNKKQAHKLINDFYTKYNLRQRIDFVIYSKNNKKAIGLFSIHNISFIDKRGEIGFILGKKYRGRNIMREIVSIMKDIMFNEFGFHKILIVVSKENVSCLKMCKKINFDEKLILKKHFFNKTRNIYEDAVMMSIIKK